jgi:hypothetical protein
MKVDRVTIRRGATVSLGNFESARVDVELSAQLDEVDVTNNASFAATYENLDEMVRTRLRDEVDAIEQGRRREESKAHRFGA